MKANISELWVTGIRIIISDNGDKITDLSDLKKCENVVIGDQGPYGSYEILLDDEILDVTFRKVTHPTGCGKLYICEIS